MNIINEIAEAQSAVKSYCPYLKGKGEEIKGCLTPPARIVWDEMGLSDESLESPLFQIERELEASGLGYYYRSPDPGTASNEKIVLEKGEPVPVPSADRIPSGRRTLWEQISLQQRALAAKKAA